MSKTELAKLEELQGNLLDDILEGTGIERHLYLEYRDGKKEINPDDAKKLSEYFRIPESFFLKQPTLIHHGSDNSFGPIYNNANYYFAKAETEDDIKKILGK